MGQILLRDPRHDPLASVAAILATGNVRFVNLESQLSDQGGVTMSPHNPLVFTGPPSGADALARAQITIVSTANNHAWDYGKKAFLETLDNLDRVSVLHVGTGRTRAEAYAPVIVERNGLRIAFLAVTDIWNQGPLEKHEAVDFVARADAGTLADSVASARASADVVIVSYHGGDQYVDVPTARTRTILRAAIDAGADAILGHHPHVIHAVEFRSGRPILYSMGNLLMKMHRDYPWTGYGYMARLTLVKGQAPRVEVCPYRIVGLVPTLLASAKERGGFERVFFGHLRQVSSALGATTRIGAPGIDGCAEVAP